VAHQTASAALTHGLPPAFAALEQGAGAVSASRGWAGRAR
jgi:hypothetical protein